MQTTLLSTIISRMNRWQTAAVVEEQYKVRDLDDALRSLKRTIEVPWNIKKSTMRIFKDVLVYPVAADHDHLAYLDTQLDEQPNTLFDHRARYFYTSLQQFYENPDYRNDLAEIWDQGTKYLGIRYNGPDFSSTVLDNKTLSHYTASNDASGLAVDTVIFKFDNSSIRFTNTVSAGYATVKCAFPAFSDTNYLRKYAFFYVYLTGAPTSIDLQFGTDTSNYLTKNVTAQFSGQSFVANDWNIVAFDLNAATTVGTINSSSFAHFAVIINGAAAGYYYIDNAYLRSWVLQDYWYYSTYAVATIGSSTANQEYFYNSSDVYATDSSLIGDHEWADVIMYDALTSLMTDKKDKDSLAILIQRRQMAWDKLLETYPSMKPLITTNKMNFETDYNDEANWVR